MALKLGIDALDPPLERYDFSIIEDCRCRNPARLKQLIKFQV
jgi:hypothetical protein